MGVDTTFRVLGRWAPPTGDLRGCYAPPGGRRRRRARLFFSFFSLFAPGLPVYRRLRKVKRRCDNRRGGGGTSPPDAEPAPATSRMLRRRRPGAIGPFSSTVSPAVFVTSVLCLPLSSKPPMGHGLGCLRGLGAHDRFNPERPSNLSRLGDQTGFNTDRTVDLLRPRGGARDPEI